MEKIGTALKERRLEMGYTLEEMSLSTKLSTIQLKAIEDGNISFFKEDLSYLTYFVRYYANALNINYDELRSELDEKIVEYTDAINVSKIKEAENINTSVMEKVRIKNTIKPDKKKAKIDFTSFALIGLVVVVVFALGFVFFTKILPSLGAGDKKPPLVVNPVPEGETPAEKPEEKPVEKPVEPEKKELVVTMQDPNTYIVSGWATGKDAIFDINVKARTWVLFSVDNVPLENPLSTIYEENAVITIVTKPKEAMELKMDIGYMASNEFLLDGKPIVLDPSVADTTGSQTLVFKFIGGSE